MLDVIIIPKCPGGCVEVETILQSYQEEFGDRFPDLGHEPLQFQCYREIKDGDYGHLNYAVVAYAAIHGHYACLKYLHQKADAMWHSDIAMSIAENGFDANEGVAKKQMQCLSYIVHKMGDVQWGQNTIPSLPLLALR